MTKRSISEFSAHFLGVCCLISKLAASVCLAAEPPLMFVGDFEHGGLAPFADTQLDETRKKAEVVADPVRAGNHALKLQLDRAPEADKKNDRTDFWIKGMPRSFQMDEEYWYGFSTFWPDSWQADTQSELFVQWIGWRDYGPSLAIYVYGEDYCIKKRWAADDTSYKNLWRGKMADDKGQWVAWVFRIKWSTGRNGLIEVWRNGEKIVTDKGQNCGPGEFADYFKFGIYKWPWQEPPEKTPSTITRRTLYIDEIRIGDKNANYDLVSPQSVIRTP